MRLPSDRSRMPGTSLVKELATTGCRSSGKCVKVENYLCSKGCSIYSRCVHILAVESRAELLDDIRCFDAYIAVHASVITRGLCRQALLMPLGFAASCKPLLQRGCLQGSVMLTPACICRYSMTAFICSHARHDTCSYATNTALYSITASKCMCKQSQKLLKSSFDKSLPDVA